MQAVFLNMILPQQFETENLVVYNRYFNIKYNMITVAS